MKRSIASLLLGLLLAPALFAQSPTSDVPTVPAARTPSTDPGEVSLIPEQVAPNEKPRTKTGAGKEPAKKSKTEEIADELRERIRFREAKTKALRDPQVDAAWERSTRATTDFEKREALKTYYKMLYARIARLDGSLKKLIAQRQQLSLRRLEQTRIDATEPLDPAEREERFERAQQ